MTDMATYDYIVVGSGSAGSVVAGRLSENPDNRVLLIEAGPRKTGMEVKVPAAFAKQFKTDLDWAVMTEPEPGLDDRVLYHPRARYLGGCSGMNAMMYVRGSRHDYDDWAKGGAVGWSYDEVLPLFKVSERNSRGASQYHGAVGPLYIEDQRDRNPLSDRIVAGMVETGMPRNDDCNGADQLGAGNHQSTLRRGQRWTTADGYVRPALKRANFTLLSDAQVHRVSVEGGRAVGVEVEVEGRLRTIRADREVILSAGAFNTPQLLMLSGIGPADHLAEHGIATLLDNPNVGAHLMDHPFYTANFETSAKGTLAEAESPIQLVKYLAARKGLLTSPIAEVTGFLRTRPDEETPDIQLVGGPAYFWDNGFSTHDKAAYVIAASLIGSKSRGSVRLRSADPKAQVAARFNYMSDPAEMDSMVAAIERIRAVADSAALKPLTTRHLHPPASVRTRAELEADIRRNIVHTYHPSCTARMGSEADGVVDHELRVHGVSGLRVADASVFPTVTHGNTHAPSVLVGEKAAAMIAAAR
ncbi:GMC family oxidoreductase [Nocardioides sambongensis]|uniref:GMC family oxidoreductase n=1 Tax=Nocardioides sambongensis TaxID=2589074 RepID=UPI0011271C04|nr:GMC family oxidoreductase N-terminal domain-containing protein [Nocardioides sambongensis]